MGASDSCAVEEDAIDPIAQQKEEEAMKNSTYYQTRTIITDIVDVDEIVDIILEYNPIQDGYCFTFYQVSYRQRDKAGKYYNPCFINVNTKFDKTLYFGAYEHTDWFIQGKYPQSVKAIRANGYHMQTIHGVNDDNCDVVIKIYDKFNDCIDTHNFENVESDGKRYFYRHDKTCPHSDDTFMSYELYKNGYNAAQFNGVAIAKCFSGYYGQRTHDI